MDAKTIGQIFGGAGASPHFHVSTGAFRPIKKM
jgi:hypothetical protein